MKWLRRVLFVLAAIYVGFCVMLFLMQRNFLFPAPSEYVGPTDVGADFMTEIDIPTPHGTVTAWWAPPSSPEGQVIMVFHGNGSAVFSNVHIFQDLADDGHGVWSVGYPGYPGRQINNGHPSEEALVSAAAVQSNLVRTEYAPDRLLNYYGTSLGTGVAAQLSREYPPERLFLDAPFHSILDMAGLRFPYLPVRGLMRDQFRSDLALSVLQVPLIWTHGTADRIVPINEGRQLYDSYNGPKQSYIIEDADHLNTWRQGGGEFVLSVLAKDKSPSPE